MLSTLDLINITEDQLNRIDKEIERLDANRGNKSSPIKIMQHQDTPIICDLTGLDVYDNLREHLYQILEERKEELKTEKIELAKKLVEELTMHGETENE